MMHDNFALYGTEATEVMGGVLCNSDAYEVTSNIYQIKDQII
jgi:hypothetical protein